MKEIEESIIRDGNADNGDSGVDWSREWMAENLRDKECESSESLKTYLRSLGSCARKKRRRCISQELVR